MANDGALNPRRNWWQLAVPLGLLMLVAYLMHTLGVVPD